MCNSLKQNPMNIQVYVVVWQAVVVITYIHTEDDQSALPCGFNYLHVYDIMFLSVSFYIINIP